MKKTYIIPKQTVVKLGYINHLMDLSAAGSASISSSTADGDAFVRQDRGWDIWDNGSIE